MKFATKLIVTACACASVTPGACAGTQARSEVNPLQKVLQLMDQMVVKGRKDKHDEQVAFAKFQTWCDSTRTATEKAIAESKASIEQLEADIEKARADAERLDEDISELDASIASKTAELNEATAINDKAVAEYDAAHKDVSESIDAIARAISVLKAKTADVPQSLLQVQSSPRIPPRARALIASFLEQSQSMLGDLAAPEANAYENQSGGIIEMLEKMKLKFEDEKAVLEKEELARKSNFELLAQKLTDDLKHEKGQVESKTAKKAQRTEDGANAEGELGITQKALAEDEKKLSTTLAECQQKSHEFEQDQVTRAGEIKAIEQAMAILQSDDVQGNADKHLPAAMVQATALVQTQSAQGVDAASRHKVAAMLRAHAQRTGSPYLSLVATHVESDPFVKVKKMIKDMIMKLMEEANAEAGQKAYCDAEMATNKLTRENKQSEVEELTAESEKNQALSAQLQEEMTALSNQMSEIRKEQSEATTIRNEEKARNTQVIKDAQVAQAAVTKATQVLKDFYENAASASFVQSGSSDDMVEEMTQAGKAPYGGQQAESGGIMGFLEVILSDFARLEAETQSAEDTGAEAYDKFMAEGDDDLAVKQMETEHKTKKRTDTEALISSLSKDIANTQAELDAANAYFEKLKPQCVNEEVSYEDRVAQREEELQSLKEALVMLQPQDLA